MSVSAAVHYLRANVSRVRDYVSVSKEQGTQAGETFAVCCRIPDEDDECDAALCTTIQNALHERFGDRREVNAYTIIDSVYRRGRHHIYRVTPKST